MEAETTAERPDGSGARHRPVDSEPPRVTPSLLRRADEMCRRRLAREHAGGKQHANRRSDARFAVSNRLLADARLAHTDPETVRAEAFVEQRELEPEQRWAYRAGALGYLAVFGNRPGRPVDLGWHTPLPDLAVDMVANLGLALDLPDGRHEIRVLKLGGRRAGAPLLDAVEVQCLLVGTAAWAPTGLRIVAVDLLEQEVVTYEPQLPRERVEAEGWIAARVAIVRHNAAQPVARAGADCNGCAFVAGCEAHAAP